MPGSQLAFALNNKGMRFTREFQASVPTFSHERRLNLSRRQPLPGWPDSKIGIAHQPHYPEPVALVPHLGATGAASARRLAFGNSSSPTSATHTRAAPMAARLRNFSLCRRFARAAIHYLERRAEFPPP